MKAIGVFPGSKEVRIIDHPDPGKPGPKQVKVRMMDVGVCGTDREICAFEFGTPPAGSDYFVLGHESLGEVVEAGPGTSRVKAGDLVVIMVRRPCEREDCVACRLGRQDFCFTNEFVELGIRRAHGFMTERVVEDEAYCVPLPRKLRPVGVLIEPLTIAEKALAQIWHVQERLPWGCPVVPGKDPGHCRHAVVLGAGPVGLLGAMAMLTSGFDVTVYSLEEETHPAAQIATAIGGSYVCAKKATLEQLAQKIGNIDVVYEATGASKVSFQLMKHLGTNGVFVLTGVPSLRNKIELDADKIMRRLVLLNQCVIGTVNAGYDDFCAAVKHLEEFQQRWPGQVKALITGHYKLEDYRKLLVDSAPGIKNVIRLQD